MVPGTLVDSFAHQHLRRFTGRAKIVAREAVWPGAVVSRNSEISRNTGSLPGICPPRAF